MSLRPTAETVINCLNKELNQAATLSAHECANAREEVLHDIASGFVSRDTAYLVEFEGEKSDGRPIPPDSKRDQWSSFIIDFGVLHKGDGFFTWNGTPDEFKKLWNDVILVITTEYLEGYKKIADIYIKKHPDLLPEDIEKIQVLEFS